MANFYDHAKNSEPARGSAVAKVRAEAIASGEAYRVEANWNGKPRFFWDGGLHAVLELAKSLVSNQAEAVEMTTPSGRIMLAAEIQAAKF